MSFKEKLKQLGAQQPGDASRRWQREKERQEQEQLRREQEWDNRVAALEKVAMRDLVPTLEEVRQTYVARGKGKLSLKSPKGNWTQRNRFPVINGGEIGRPYTILELEWLAPDSDRRIDRWAGDYHIFVTLRDDQVVSLKGAGSKSPGVMFNLGEEDWHQQYEDGLLGILANPEVCIDDTPWQPDHGGAR